MRIFDSKPMLRWLTPAAVVLVVAGGSLVASNASAGDKLPDRSVEQLLVDLQQPQVDGLSGTIVQKANLGLPDIPGANGGTSELTSLLSGSHTMYVWYSGPDKARVAVKDGAFKESDVVANGSDVWTWSSADKSATHRSISKTDRSGMDAHKTAPNAPKTPQDAAAELVKALGPSTTITPDSDVTVAGEKAYELVLRPKDPASTMSEVRIAIDGKTHLPLRVQAYNTDSALVFQVEYTAVKFARPDDSMFAFNPPADTKVTEAPKVEHKAPTKAEQAQAKEKADQAKSATKVVGSGWTSVVVTKLPANADQNNPQLQSVLSKLQTTPDGKGKLFVGTAFSAVITDDGRVAVGAVKPDLLYKALEK
jgi:outer membrane lipoprotein-sorting protein